MTNAEFQKIVLEELKSINGRMGGMEDRMTGLEDRITGLEDRITGLEDRITGLEDRITGVEGRIDNIENNISKMKVSIEGLSVRQDEIYQVVRSIEHSNNVGKAKLDEHGYRIAKNEGTFKKFKKALQEIDDASNM